MEMRPRIACNWMNANEVSITLIFSITFSNSLIIHEEKTKEIITVRKGWLCVLNNNIIIKFGNFCFEFLLELLMLWEVISNNQKSVSSDIKTLHSCFKKAGLCLIFCNPLLHVWISDEILYLVFDIRSLQVRSMDHKRQKVFSELYSSKRNKQKSKTQSK